MTDVTPFTISGCMQLINIEIDYIEDVKELYIDDCPVLMVNGIQNFSNMTSIENLSLKGIGETGPIDLSFAPNLKTLDTTGTPAASVTIADSVLNTAVVTTSPGTTVTIPELPSDTTEFTALNSSLTTYDFSTLPNLVILNIQGSSFTTLDVMTNISLVTLNAFGNRLTSITFSPSGGGLQTLNIGNNNLTGSLVLAMYSSLTNIACDLNNLSGLIVPTSIEILSCSDNALLTLDLSSLSLLTRLTCHNCNISTLNVLYTPVLTYLACSGNNINQVFADAIADALVANGQINGTLIIQSQRTPIGNLNITGGSWDTLNSMGWQIL